MRTGCTSPRRKGNVCEAVVHVAQQQQGDVQSPGTARQRVHAAVFACVKTTVKCRMSLSCVVPRHPH